MTFEELNLSAPLLRAVQEAGYETQEGRDA